MVMFCVYPQLGFQLFDPLFEVRVLQGERDVQAPTGLGLFDLLYLQLLAQVVYRGHQDADTPGEISYGEIVLAHALAGLTDRACLIRAAAWHSSQIWFSQHYACKPISAGQNSQAPRGGHSVP